MDPLTPANPIWLKIGSIASVVAIVVAAIPMTRIRLLRSRRKAIVRNQFLFDLYALHRLLIELALTEIVDADGEGRILIRTALPPLVSFESPEEALAKSKCLPGPERKNIALSLKFFASAEPNAEEEEARYLSESDIVDAEYFVCSLIRYIESQLGVSLTAEEIRMEAYNKCFDTAQISGTRLPDIDALNAVIRTDR